MLDTEAAERAILGAAMVRPDEADQALDLPPDHFRDPHRREIWTAVVTLRRRGVAIDPVTLDAELRAGGHPVQVDRLVALMDDYRVGGVRSAAQELRRAHRVWTLRSLAAELQDACKSDDADPDDLAARYLGRLTDLERNGDERRLIPAKEIVARTVTNIAQRAKGEVKALSTGLPSLDRLIGGGLEPGWQVLIAARPKMGKTALAMTLAMGVTTPEVKGTGAPVLLFSLEMSDVQLGRRIIADRSGVPVGALKNPTPEQFARIQPAISWAKSDPDLVVWDAPASIADIERETRRWARELKRRGKLGKGIRPPVVIVDYLQLVRPERGRSREEEVASASRNLKLLWKELGVCGIVLCQLNRKCEERAEKRPMASDLRESGALEQDADAVLLLFRPWVYDRSKNSRACEVIAALARESEMGASCWLDFIADQAYFRERDSNGESPKA